MSTILIALASFFGFILAYNTYGKFLAQKIFQIQSDEPVPSVELRDNNDFIPTKRHVLFGHHFTTIAGTGPIVGPAIAVMWGWLPALLWVVLGSIFIGAVHDFTALILSLRNKGQTLGEITGKILSPSARLMFMILLVFLLAIVVAIFCIVIAQIFESYPASVIPSLISIPIALVLGTLTYHYGVPLSLTSLVSVAILGISMIISATYPAFSIAMPNLTHIHETLNPAMNWTWVLLMYCFAASVLPVWLLLQPRDYVNSVIFYIALGLIAAGLVVAGLFGAVDLFASAPAFRLEEAKQSGAPPILPFLFITVACGAVSGFHALVSSGTSSKQIASMKDAPMVGFGGMLLEGSLAVLVILSCTAGIGMGIANLKSSAEATGSATVFTEVNTSKPETVFGREAWNLRYDRPWREMNLGEQVGVFIEGGANFIGALGIPVHFGQGIIAILIALFAATTIDSALRFMRYMLQELAGPLRMAPLKNRYIATAVGLGLAASLALCKASPEAPYGTGGLILWPLLGAGNQVVAGLTLLVGCVYLLRRKVPTIYLMVPALFMILIPLWAMSINIFASETGFLVRKQYLLTTVGVAIILLACWLVVEAYRAMRKLVELDKG